MTSQANANLMVVLCQNSIHREPRSFRGAVCGPGSSPTGSVRASRVCDRHLASRFRPGDLRPMKPSLAPLQFLFLVVFAGWDNHEQEVVIAYLREEIAVLR